MWGQQREIFEIKEIRLIVENIYPAYYQFYNTYPLALVSVKNLAGYPIEVNARCFVAGYSAKPKDSGFIRIPPGKTKDIPVTAFFNEQLKLTAKRQTAILDLNVEARAGATYRKQVSSQVIVHHRNAWNGEVDKLAFFVTPDNPDVLELSRRIAERLPENERRVPNFHLARRLFDQLRQSGLRYHRDPNIPYYRDDRVQFADETYKIKLGDCDDLVVLYSSLLESAGIETAFVEVRDPEKEIAHLYLLFDSGLAPEQSNLISRNEKRFVVRESETGRKKIWIPVETTLVEAGFESAWLAGAKSWLHEGVLRGGLIAEWVRVFDVK